jgi:hypothetical protein
MANLREENEPQIRTKFPCDVNVRGNDTVIDVKWPLPAFHFVCNDCNDDFSGGNTTRPLHGRSVRRFEVHINYYLSINLHHLIKEFRT